MARRRTRSRDCRPRPGVLTARSPVPRPRVGALGCGMAPIRWFVHRGPRFGWTLLGGCLALILTAAPAAAELSSVDAYGGQAQVLGKPVHRHGAGTGSTGAQGSGRGQSTGASGSAAGGSSGSAAGSGSSFTPGAGSGAPTTPSRSNSAAGAGGGNTTGGGERGGAGGHGGGSGTRAAGAGSSAGASGGVPSPPIAAANAADVSDGSLSLSALDMLLLAAVFVGLACVGVLIRRWSRQSE